MRLRKKPWARPELAACTFFIDNPLTLKGNWKKEFNNENPIHLELGCGKGNFVAQIGCVNPDINYIAIDIKSEVLGLGKRKCEELYKEKGLDPHKNLRLMSHDIERLLDIMEEDEKIHRIYINFCNPWSKPRHLKHRLTHTKQLTTYRKLLIDGGEIHFKTDSDELFEESLVYFEEANYTVTYKTYDLHASGYVPNYTTEHERMYTEEGIKIKFLIATPVGTHRQA